MEREPRAREAAEAFFTQLQDAGVINEVRPGRDIASADYRFVSGEEIAAEDMINILAGYVSAPMLIDSFTLHEEERVPAINNSNLLTEETLGFYHNNRLRYNKIAGVLRNLKAISQVREFPESFRTFVAEQTADLYHDGYNTWDIKEKIMFVEKLTATAAAVLDRAVTEGIIAGPTIST